jgi:hypothetical protein
MNPIVLKTPSECGFQLVVECLDVLQDEYHSLGDVCRRSMGPRHVQRRSLMRPEMKFEHNVSHHVVESSKNAIHADFNAVLLRHGINLDQNKEVIVIQSFEDRVSVELTYIHRVDDELHYGWLGMWEIDTIFL